MWASDQSSRTHCLKGRWGSNPVGTTREARSLVPSDLASLATAAPRPALVPNLRLGKELAQFLRHQLGLPASVGIARGPMIESGELSTFGMRQDLLQGVKGDFEVSRAPATAEQEHNRRGWP